MVRQSKAGGGSFVILAASIKFDKADKLSRSQRLTVLLKLSKLGQNASHWQKRQAEAHGCDVILIGFHSTYNCDERMRRSFQGEQSQGKRTRTLPIISKFGR
jgi:hypothetical protein